MCFRFEIPGLRGHDSGLGFRVEGFVSEGEKKRQPPGDGRLWIVHGYSTLATFRGQCERSRKL